MRAYPQMNPIFLDWWRGLGGAGQITLVVAVLAGFFGVLKILLEKHFRWAIASCIVALAAFALFVFWPSTPKPIATPAAPRPPVPAPTTKPPGRVDARP